MSEHPQDPKVIFWEESKKAVWRQSYSDAASFRVGGSSWAPIRKLPSQDPTGWANLDQSLFIAQVNTLNIDPAEQAQRFEREFRTALGYTQRVRELCLRLETLETVLTAVVKKLDRVADQPHGSIWVPIENFPSEPYIVLRPMTAVVVSSDEGFEAAVYDLNLHASGDTEEEAVTSLKSLLLDLFDHLSSQQDETLGPEPLKQKQFLLQHITKA